MGYAWDSSYDAVPYQPLTGEDAGSISEGSARSGMTSSDGMSVTAMEGELGSRGIDIETGDSLDTESLEQNLLREEEKECLVLLESINPSTRDSATG